MTIPVSGTLNTSGQLSLTGTTTVGIGGVPTAISLYAWNTLVSSRNMTGTFGLSYTFEAPDVMGVPRRNRRCARSREPARSRR